MRARRWRARWRTSNTSSNRRSSDETVETMDGDDAGRGVLKEVEVNRDDELRDEGATRSTATERR